MRVPCVPSPELPVASDEWPKYQRAAADATTRIAYGHSKPSELSCATIEPARIARKGTRGVAERAKSLGKQINVIVAARFLLQREDRRRRHEPFC